MAKSYKKIIKIFFLIGCAACFSFYIYGVFFKILNTEKNECRMTYMFEYPYFWRIKFKENSLYPKYGLYAYSEGMHAEKIQSRLYNGAPVIFVPGNSGSYKQVRSLASVALRKAIDMNWKKNLDYFSVDFNEELSGVFGGYLTDQKSFLKICIHVVLNLYSNLGTKPAQVILIGHSMGGKIAQSLLADEDIATYINTIITIATPVDKPVINIDSYIDSFYNEINEYMIDRRSLLITENTTNYCRNPIDQLSLSRSDVNTKMPLDDKLLISIGGDSRDFLVYEGLTKSKFSDINVLTTSIPDVWVSTDHLCAVWCLQLVLVINRLLFSLVPFHHHGRNQYKNALNFIEEKSEKLSKAEQFLLNPSINLPNGENDFLSITQEEADWFEDSRRTFVEKFLNGIQKTRIQMIRLLDDFQHAVLSVETVNVNVDDSIFGCSATEVSGTQRFCSKLIRFPYTLEKLPSEKNIRHFLTLDLEKIREDHPDWTHVILYIRPSNRKIKFRINVYAREDNLVSVYTPKWYEFYNQLMHSQTISGTSLYKILLPDVTESYQMLRMKVNPIDCSSSPSILKICVPWIKGLQKYRILKKQNQYMTEIYSSLSKPLNYNTSVNPIFLELHLNSECSYNISIKNSVGGMASRILQQNYHHFPSYVLSILILILQDKVSMKVDNGIKRIPLIPVTKCFSSLIVSLMLINLLSWSEITLLSSSVQSQSLFISITMSGASLVLIQILLSTLWFMMNCFVKIFRLLSSITAKLEIHLPLEKGNYFLSTAFVALFIVSLISCGGVALILACLVYFLMLVKNCETYLNLIETKNSIDKEKKNDENSLKTSKTQMKNSNDSNLINETLLRLHIHMVFFMMVIQLMLLNIPSTLCWIKNLRFFMVLKPDPSLKPTCSALVFLYIIWQLSLSKKLNIWNPFYWLCNFCVLFCIIYCQELVFWINYLISLIFSTFIASQLVVT